MKNYIKYFGFWTLTWFMFTLLAKWVRTQWPAIIALIVIALVATVAIREISHNWNYIRTQF